MGEIARMTTGEMRVARTEAAKAITRALRDFEAITGLQVTGLTLVRRGTLSSASNPLDAVVITAELT